MKLPNGFVPPTSSEVDFDGSGKLLEQLKADKYFRQVPCTLFTDGSIHYFVIEHEGKEYVLPLRTD